MRYKRKGKITEKVNLMDLSSLQKWILTHPSLKDWKDFGSVVSICKPYQSESGKRILASNMTVGRALKGLVSKGLLERD